MMILSFVLAAAFAVAIAVAVGRRRPAGPVRVTAEEVMKTDALLRQLGGLDEEDRRREQRRQAVAERTGRARANGGGTVP